MWLAIISIVNLLRLAVIFLLALLLFPVINDSAIYLFLRLSGPTFIKLGQLLSTRPDLMGDDLADVLSHFQDQLPAFSFNKVEDTILSEFNQEIDELFLELSEIPVASASMAQVHQAKTLDGDVVAVKILRPRIVWLVKRDIATLKLLASLIGIFSSYKKEKLLDIASLLESCATKELDLVFEAAIATELKEKLIDIKGFYVPKVYWPLTTKRVMTLEWIDGIPFSNKAAILNSNFDKKIIAENLVVSYFNQVYVHGIFHADMHPGNLFLMKNGDIGVVDFGIVGTIDKKTRIAIAEILIAFLSHDYEKVARLHISAGLISEDVNFAELVLSCRIVGQSIIDKKVNQVSLATLLANLLQMTQKFNMKTKPDLLLLQKTMMLLEGVGVWLNPDLNIWDLARPFIKEWAIKNIGWDAKIRDAFFDFLQLVKKFPDNINSHDKAGEVVLRQEIKVLQAQEKKLKVVVMITIIIFIFFLLIKH